MSDIKVLLQHSDVDFIHRHAAIEVKDDEKIYSLPVLRHQNGDNYLLFSISDDCAENVKRYINATCSKRKLEIVIDILRAALKEDPEYYDVWKANIAVAFQDEYQKTIASQPQEDWVHKLSNDAAKRFLDQLTSTKK